MKKYVNIYLVLFLLISLTGLAGCCGLSTKKSLIELKLTPGDVDRMVREGQKEELQKEIEKGRVAKTAFGYYLNPCYTSQADYDKITCGARKDEAKMLKYGIPLLGHALSFKRVVEYFIQKPVEYLLEKPLELLIKPSEEPEKNQ